MNHRTKLHEHSRIRSRRGQATPHQLANCHRSLSRQPTTSNRADASAAVGGWHWTEWLCECMGTTLLLFAIVMTVAICFAPGGWLPSRLPDLHARLLIVGVVAGGTGALFALTPPGRRSGAHLNPAVSFAFWVRRQMHPHDLGGYIAAQLGGSLVGALLARYIGGSVIAGPAIRFGTIAPSPQVALWQAGLGETLMTATLILTIFFCLSRPALLAWTPGIVALVITGCIALAGPFTGAGLNPARSFGPALLGRSYGGIIFYGVFPLLGSLLAAAIWHLGGNHRLLTSKLFHDAAYPTTMATHLKTASTEW